MGCYRQRLELTGGLRYFTEDLEGVRNDRARDGGGPTDGPIPDDAQSNEQVTGKLNLAYQANEDLLLYATVAQGFRSGWFERAKLNLRSHSTVFWT